MRAKFSLLSTLCAAIFVAGCAQSNPEWEKVRKLDTPEAYEKFEKQFPASREIELSRTRRAALLDEREWQGASRVDTAEAYAAYLAQHPSGLWVARARLRQAELVAAAPPAPDAAAAEAVAKAAGVPSSEESAQPVAPVVAKASAPEPVKAKAAETAVKPQKSAESVTLQLGAFSSAERAQKSWREAQGIVASLRGAKPSIAHGAGSSLYRLRVEVVSRTEGERVCNALRKAGGSCIVL